MSTGHVRTWFELHPNGDRPIHTPAEFHATLPEAQRAARRMLQRQPDQPCVDIVEAGQHGKTRWLERICP